MLINIQLQIYTPQHNRTFQLNRVKLQSLMRGPNHIAVKKPFGYKSIMESNMVCSGALLVFSPPHHYVSMTL